jgi:hypothetical protein
MNRRQDAAKSDYHRAPTVLPLVIDHDDVGRRGTSHTGTSHRGRSRSRSHRGRSRSHKDHGRSRDRSRHRHVQFPSSDELDATGNRARLASALLFRPLVSLGSRSGPSTTSRRTTSSRRRSGAFLDLLENNFDKVPARMVTNILLIILILQPLCRFLFGVQDPEGTLNPPVVQKLVVIVNLQRHEMDGMPCRITPL